MARVAEKLREQDSLARCITVFLRTTSFDENAPHYTNEFTIDLLYPTAFTPELIRHALSGLHAIYRTGYRYQKAGISLAKITPLPVMQPDLLGEISLIGQHRQDHLMAIIDALNRIFGRDTLFFAAQGTARTWKMRQSKLSSRSTTQWGELQTVT